MTAERLSEVWTTLAQQQKPNLKSAMLQNPAVLGEDGVSVTFTVVNSVQQMWVMKNMHTLLTDKLREELHNGKIVLSVEVKSLEEMPKVPYMPEERAKHIIKNNPEVQEMVKDLDLEIK